MSQICNSILITLAWGEGFGPHWPASPRVSIGFLVMVRLGDDMNDSDANGQAHEASEAAQATDGTAQGNDRDIVVTTAATVGVVAVGAALFEVALLPGIALGVAAMLAPKYAPNISAAIGPMFRSSVRGLYKFGQKTNEMVAEAKEQVQDIVAEVKAEQESSAEEEGKAEEHAAAAPEPVKSGQKPSAAATSA
jgi:hypothetical protein